MRYRVLPYKQGSKSAKALAEALNGKVLKLQNSKFKPKSGDVIINWGSSSVDGLNQYPATSGITVLNSPPYVRHASNKKDFFGLMYEKDKEIIPEFWTKKEDIPDDVYPIVCRTVLSGHSGNGIVIATTPGELVEAPLYVRYIKKKDEYRVHLGKKESFVGEDDHSENNNGFATTVVTIAVQRKARRQDCETPNWQVRNHNNGFVFVRSNVNPPDAVIEAAKKAFTATGLDFGAVDVIWNEQQGKAYVLEINTAPGLEGQTVQDYADFFKNLDKGATAEVVKEY